MLSFLHYGHLIDSIISKFPANPNLLTISLCSTSYISAIVFEANVWPQTSTLGLFSCEYGTNETGHTNESEGLLNIVYFLIFLL